MKNTDLTRPQLFLDDKWVERSNFVQRAWHQAIKHPEPVLKPDRPWEQCGLVAYGTVLNWRGKFRMWYTTWMRSEPRRVCYAESENGLLWHKPELDLCECDGDKRNNVVMQSGNEHGVIDNITVIDDPDDSEWPLKAIYWEKARASARPGDYRAARSKDGLTWDTSLGIVLPEWGDRFNAVSSRVDGKFVVYGRAPVEVNHWSRKGRRVYRTESEDLVHWTEPEEVLGRDLEDPPDMQYYSMSVFPYSDLTLGGLERMYVSPDKLDTEILFSRDRGHTWQHSRTRPRFIPWGLERAWDDTWVSLPTNAPIAHHGQLWFYYSGRSGAHATPYPRNHSAIGLAMLRIDGFASLYAGDAIGHFVTPPFEWPGDVLHLNVDPRRDLASHLHMGVGEVRVEIQDANMTPLAGFSRDECVPLTRNTVHLPDSLQAVEWKDGKTTATLAGQRVRLDFELRNAHVYSFCARPRQKNRKA